MTASHRRSKLLWEGVHDWGSPATARWLRRRFSEANSVRDFFLTNVGSASTVLWSAETLQRWERPRVGVVDPAWGMPWGRVLTAVLAVEVSFIIGSSCFPWGAELFSWAICRANVSRDQDSLD